MLPLTDGAVAPRSTVDSVPSAPRFFTANAVFARVAVPSGSSNSSVSSVPSAQAVTKVGAVMSTAAPLTRNSVSELEVVHSLLLSRTSVLVAIDQPGDPPESSVLVSAVESVPDVAESITSACL